MGRRVNSCVVADPYDYSLLTEFANLFEDFAVAFAHAFRYYIAGLIIGCFLFLLLKKCYSGWTARRGFSWPYSSGTGDPNEENKGVDQQDGNLRLKKGSSLDCCKQGDASRNPDALPSAKERQTAVDYWKQCFDSFGYVVVDTLNPGAPFRHHLDSHNIPHKSSITLHWEPNLGHAHDVPKSSKSSSTTDILRNVSAYSQVMSGDLKRRNKQDSSVDTRDLENAPTVRRSIRKRRNNKKLDTFDLRNVGLNESDSAAYNSVRNDAVLTVRKKPKTTVLANTVKSSLLPGQKVSRNAVIILRLRDNGNASNEERDSLSSRKTLGLGGKNRIKKYSYFRTSAEKRKRRETLMARKKPVHKIPSDENSSGSFESHKNTRSPFSFSKLSKNYLQCPFSKKKHLLSNEKYTSRVRSRKSFKQDTEGMAYSQSQNSHSLIIHKSNEADKSLPSQDFSKRQCFKYKGGSRKRQKIAEYASKADLKSLSRFLCDLKKPNPSTIKQSIGSIWMKNNLSNKKDVYQVEVIEPADGLRNRARSKCRFQENAEISKNDVQIFNSMGRDHRNEQRSLISNHKTSEASCDQDSEDVCYIRKVSGPSVVSVGMKNKQDDKSNKIDLTSYSEISTGSESLPSDVVSSSLLPDKREVKGRGKVEHLDDNCNKNIRGQFWKIFGSRNTGK